MERRQRRIFPEAFKREAVEKALIQLDSWQRLGIAQRFRPA